MRKGLLTSFLLLLTLCLYSQSHPFEEENARTFFELNYPDGSLSTKQYSIDTSFVYKNLTIVNFASPRGFVMLRTSSEDYEVMGYSYSDHFSFDIDTTGVIESWADALSESSHLPGYDPGKTIPRLKTGRLEVEPLCQTKWGQGWPYNYYCPMDQVEDHRTLVGCVAVAVGQIIRYYDKWNNFHIQHSYTHEDYGTLSCSAGQYNWFSMENKCLGVNHEVARILYHSGVLVDMGYGPGSSGAQSAKAASLFNRIYDGGYLNEDPYGVQDAFYNSISNYKPIYSTYTGHAFVCDGFDGNNFYHFNLGWGGGANGYYPLTNVLDHSLLSAIFDTSPSDSLKPPGNFRKNIISDTEVEISWDGPVGEREGLLGYSIYLDDVYFDETPDTVFLHSCQPGSHYLRVSANYTDGESRWIGPGKYFSHGNPISISDDKLRQAMNISIGVPSSERNTHEPTEGELFDIRYLNVTNANNLAGISNCTNLDRLVLFSTSENTEIDLTELQECTGILLFRASNYHLINPQAIGALSKMQELELNKNTISDMGFLSNLKDLYKLDIKDIHIDNIAFLNDLDRLTWISLEGCDIQDFDILENTYGVEHLNISYNDIGDIEWINGNRTLIFLDVSNNQLSGLVNLDGLTKLKTLSLSNNHIEKLNVTNSEQVEIIHIANNQIGDFQNILDENENITELDISGNLIKILPSVDNRLLDLDVSDNLLFDLLPLDHYSNIVDLDLQGNNICDLFPLVYKNYSNGLERINLRENPISKESFLDHKPIISDLAARSYFPSRYHPDSPCYLEPTKDSVMMTRSIQFSWEGDYDGKGYLYDLYMRHEEGDFTLIAKDLDSKSFATELEESGNYSWFTIAHLNDDSLQSGYGNFKVFSGFSIPFVEDFEIYNPNEQLCSQSPFWRIFGEDQASNRDAFVINTRAYQSDQSIKIASTTDLLFPVSEYLTGYCDLKFRMMVDNNRQATVKTLLSDGSSLAIFFYSAEICEVYHNQTKENFFSFQARSWMEMKIQSDPESGVKWYLDNNLIHSIDQDLAVDGIRFNSDDGPGYYSPAPTVTYIDDFEIDSGTLLSAPGIKKLDDFSGNLYFNGEAIIIENAPAGLHKVELYNVSGQLMKTVLLNNEISNDCRIPLSGAEPLIIAVLYDSKRILYSRKIITLH